MINWITFKNKKINIPNQTKLKHALKANEKQYKQTHTDQYENDLQYNIYLIKLLLDYSKKRLNIPYCDGLDDLKNDIKNLISFSGYYLNLDQNIIDYFENFNFD